MKNYRFTAWKTDYPVLRDPQTWVLRFDEGSSTLEQRRCWHEIRMGTKNTDKEDWNRGRHLRHRQDAILITFVKQITGYLCANEHNESRSKVSDNYKTKPNCRRTIESRIEASVVTVNWLQSCFVRLQPAPCDFKIARSLSHSNLLISTYICTYISELTSLILWFPILFLISILFRIFIPLFLFQRNFSQECY